MLSPGNTNCTDYLGVFTGVNFMKTLTGESLPYSPRGQANATVKYNIRLGESMSLVPRVNYSYVGTSYASLFQIDFYKLPSHGLVNVYLDWNAGPWTTTLFATNVGDKLYVTSLSGTSEYYGDPRVLGLQVNRTF